MVVQLCHGLGHQVPVALHDVFVDLSYYGTVDRNVHECVDDWVGKYEFLKVIENLRL